MINPDFNKYPDKLIPVVIQDAITQKVLMLGYMNDEALAQTIEGQRVVFFSRSRNTLWLKGHTSGNYLLVKEILQDCDLDCLLILANPTGPVCHTGADTCFGQKNKLRMIDELEKIIQQREEEESEGSYIKSLFTKGINKIAQKVGEEAVEMIIEAKDDNKALFLNEAADLLFHYLILLRAKNTTIKDIEDILESRKKSMAANINQRYRQQDQTKA